MQPGLRSNYFRQQPFQGLPFTILDVQTWYYAQTSGHNHTKASHSPFLMCKPGTMPKHQAITTPRPPIHHSWCANLVLCPNDIHFRQAHNQPPIHHSWCANTRPQPIQGPSSHSSFLMCKTRYYAQTAITLGHNHIKASLSPFLMCKPGTMPSHTCIHTAVCGTVKQTATVKPFC